MKLFILLCISTLLAIQQGTHAQTREIWRGVFLFGQSNANLRQLRDSLHVNIVEYSTGYGDPLGDSLMMANKYVGVINQNAFLTKLSQARRISYRPGSTGPGQAPTFQRKHAQARMQAGGTLSIRADQQGQPGILLDDMTPSPVSSEDRYPSKDYYATIYFSLPMEGAPSPAPVARFTATCRTHGVIAERDIKTGDTVVSRHPLKASLHFSTAHAPGGSCRDVDLQVFWNGKVSLDVDSIVVEDEIAHTLFNHSQDADINREIRKNYALPAHRFFYLMDEPDPVSFAGFRYVADRIRHTVANGSVTAMNGYVEEFAREAGALWLLVDWYFLTTDIPIPSLRGSDRLAREAGIEPWDAEKYRVRLQHMVQRYITRVLGPATEATHSHNMFLGQVLQFHGIISRATGKYEATGARLRPPSPSELRLQCGLALAYGAKGVVGFPFGTAATNDEVMPGLISPDVKSTKPSPRGSKMSHGSNLDTFYGRKIWTGYAEKWKEVAVLYARLRRLNHPLVDLVWRGSKSWSTAFVTGAGTPVISRLSTRPIGGKSDDDTAFVECGQFGDHSGRTYVILANRRCAATDSRDVSLWFSRTNGNLRVTEMERNRKRLVAPGRPFRDDLRPGDFKVYRIEAASGPR